jgi:hypothetical protein
MSVLILLSLNRAWLSRSHGNLPSDESSKIDKKGTIIYCIKFFNKLNRKTMKFFP